MGKNNMISSCNKKEILQLLYIKSVHIMYKYIVYMFLSPYIALFNNIIFIALYNIVHSFLKIEK